MVAVFDTSRRDLLLLGVAGAAALALAPRLPAPRIPLFDFAIAGGWFHGLGQVFRLLLPGMTLDLRAEFDNPHDARAVAVHMPAAGDHAGLRLGYLPRAHNAALARLLLRGAVLGAAVVGRLGDGEGCAVPDGLAFTSFTAGDPWLRVVLEG